LDVTYCSFSANVIFLIILEQSIQVTLLTIFIYCMPAYCTCCVRISLLAVDVLVPIFWLVFPLVKHLL